MYNQFQEQQERPTTYLVNPQTIEQYQGQYITTTIKDYGQVTAQVINYNKDTGMAGLNIITPQGPRYMQVHYSDMIGIGPATFPPPGQPGGGQGGGGHGGGQHGGGWHGGGQHGGGGQPPGGWQGMPWWLYGPRGEVIGPVMIVPYPGY